MAIACGDGWRVVVGRGPGAVGDVSDQLAVSGVVGEEIMKGLIMADFHLAIDINRLMKAIN